MKVHLVDGTYELFRQHFGRAAREPDAGPYAATAGVLTSTLQLLADGATHVAVASDHVIESFRNDLWPGYKTSAGMPPELLAQIPMMEEALVAMGVTTWAMVEHEADDALGAAAARRRRRRAGRAGADRHAGQGPRPVRARARGSCSSTAASGRSSTRTASIAKFGVPPASIPDYLGLVGDSADGFPGLAGLGRQERVGRARPVRPPRGHPRRRPASGTCPACAARRSCRRRCAQDLALALLFRRIATVETDVDVGTVDDWAVDRPDAGVRRLGRRRRRAPPGRAGRHPGRGPPDEPSSPAPSRRGRQIADDGDDPCARGDGQAICGTRAVPLKAATSRS